MNQQVRDRPRGRQTWGASVLIVKAFGRDYQLPSVVSADTTFGHASRAEIILKRTFKYSNKRTPFDSMCITINGI